MLLSDDMAKAEWRAAWPLPLVSMVGVAVGAYYLYTIGLFVAPLEAEFGWSRAQTMMGLSIVSIISMVVVPLMGFLIDRFGARRIALPGMVLYCAAMSGLGLATPSIWVWWGLWIFIGFGSATVCSMVWSTAVASRFDRSRGLALAIMLCGSGIGTATAPLLAEQLIETVGWRGAYFGIGGILAVASLPLLFFFFYSASDLDLRRQRAGEQGMVLPMVPGLSIHAALRSWRFIRLMFSAFVLVFAMLSMVIHFVPILTSFGVERTDAAHAAAFIGVGSVAGRLLGGVLLDRIHGTIVGGATFASPILASIALLVWGGDPHMIYGVAFFLGVALGCEMDVLAYLCSRYVGMKNFGMLLGMITALQLLAMGTGPPSAGWIFDLYNSYTPVLMGVIPLFALAAILVATLGPYAYGPGETAVEESVAGC